MRLKYEENSLAAGVGTVGHAGLLSGSGWRRAERSRGFESCLEQNFIWGSVLVDYRGCTAVLDSKPGAFD